MGWLYSLLGIGSKLTLLPAKGYFAVVGSGVAADKVVSLARGSFSLKIADKITADGAVTKLTLSAARGMYAVSGDDVIVDSPVPAPTPVPTPTPLPVNKLTLTAGRGNFAVSGDGVAAEIIYHRSVWFFPARRSIHIYRKVPSVRRTRLT